MQKMGTDDGRGGGAADNNNHSDTESVGNERNSSYSGPFSGPLNKRTRKSARFNMPETTTISSSSSTTTGTGGGSSSFNNKCNNNETYVDITLDVHDDSVAVHSVKTAGGGDPEDPVLTLLAKSLEKKFISKTDGGGSEWLAVDKKFNELTEKTNGLLPRALLCECLGMNKESKELALELFDALARRRNIVGGAVHKMELKEFWDQSFDSRLQTFFDIRFDRTLKGLKFIISKTDGGGSGWLAVDKKFNELTESTNGLLPRALFCECIGMNPESTEFALELFDALARRRNIVGGAVNKMELKEFWDQISDQSFDSRLQTFFDMVDNGRITKEEVKEIISLSASANKLSNIQKQPEEYAALIMEELDPDNLGYIMIHNLETLLLQAPNQSTTRRGGESRNLSQMLSQKLKPTKESNPFKRFYQSTHYFLIDNWQRVWVMALWLALMAGLFTYKFIQYKNKAAYEIMGYCVCTAKGAAEILKLNMALILLPVCRNTITWLRNKTKLGVAVPFDDNLNFHKVIAIAIAIGVALHGGAHLTCDFPRLLHASEEEYEPMKPYFGDEQPQNYWWFVKGIEGVTGIVMVVLMAIAFILASPWFRRNRITLPKPFNRLTGFNMFWYSHHLFIIVYALLIVHGIKLYLSKEWYKKTTWMYLAVPVTLYACERLIRALRSSVKSVKILKVAVYPGNVLALHMSKPQGFRYKSGQYMFVNCSAVSPFEWHPFSITSAPKEDYLSVHIRTAGDWTRQLKKVFSEVCQPPTGGKSGLLRADFMQGGGGGGNNRQISFPRVLIDGPYGAPAQDYKDYEVVLLVGLGIGATPMISILKDIVYNMKAKEEEEEMVAMSSEGTSSSGTTTPLPAGSTANGGASTSSKKGPGFRARRAYFYWLKREQGSFDWFKGVMNEVAEMDQKGVIELNYCTSVYEEGDARSALIAMLQSLNHAKHGVDVVSGTRVKTHFAKPNWRNVYNRIALNHKDCRVGVFSCGIPALTTELRHLARDFSHKTSTKFDFHKENF